MSALDLPAQWWEMPKPPSRQTGGVKSNRQKWLGLRFEVLGCLRPSLNASTKLQDITPSGPPGLTAEREARKEEALDNVPCRKGRERTIVTESDEHWSCLKGNVWGTSASERRGGTCKGFSERIDTTSSRTEPSERSCVKVDVAVLGSPS